MLRSLLLVVSVANANALVAHTRFAARPAVVRTSQAAAVALSPQLGVGEAAEGYDAWTATLDYKAFRKEVHDLGQNLANQQGAADISHLKKMIAWSNTCGLVGVLTMWMSSPLGRLVSILGLSTWTCTRWTMIGHHICHGGYNRQDDPKMGGTGRFTTYGFAVGSVFRRCRDWLDWMLPEAWNVEHNNLHHYRLSEAGDPDLVERNMEMLRDLPLPRAMKYVVVGFMAAMWKWFYYAPNTYKELKIAQLRKAGKPIPEDAHQPFTLPAALGLSDRGKAAKFDTSPLDFMKRVMGPYLLGRFFVLPAPLLLISRPLYLTAITNLALADLFSNIHSFIIIATNHCGDDMYKFEGSCTPRSGTFYMRAVTSSANFRTSNGIDANGKARKVHGNMADLNDFLHGWLNYQVEHHSWPQLSMLSYQKAAPQLREICNRYDVPYVQENVFKRLKKTADIMVGATTMRTFDATWENEADQFTWADQKGQKVDLTTTTTFETV